MSVSARLQHWRSLLGPFGKVMGAAYFLAGVLTFIRDNLLPPERRAEWDTFKLLPHWPLSWWLVAGLSVLLVSLLEGSYRAWKENDPQTTQPPEISLGNSGPLFHVLRIKNLGHSATFRAELRVVDSNAFHDSMIGPQGPLWWETGRDINVWLPTGASDWIILARRDLFTFFRFNATMRSTVPLLDGMSASERPYVVFEVAVFGDPPFEGGELTRRFRYERFGQSPGDIRLVPVDA